MIVDGRTLAGTVLARTKVRAEALPNAPQVLAIVANETSATKSYLAIKIKRAAEAGCILEVRHIKSSVRPFEIIDMSKDVDALIVQLPLLADMNQKEILDAIPQEKDADVLSSRARAEGELLPPVVAAVAEIFRVHAVETRGKKAVVIGAGFLVGAPVATWLAQQEVVVSVVTIENSEEEMSAALRAADIIISGAGSPHFIKPEMLKQGVVLIDAGTSESNGEVVGDADPACAAKCSLFTPVPGGVGPLAVACLFENAVTLTERAIHS